MPRIFISYSSQDRTATAQLRGWLEQQGHHSYFIDFDEHAGIVGGADWERTLYEQMQRCEAVIALLTPNWLASKWCFGEVVLARAHGKPILPIKLQQCEKPGVLADLQAIDFTKDVEEGYRRLATGLKACGLDPHELFSWDPSRPPYPGLPAHQEEDAAVFFGRAAEIQDIRETLTRLRSHPQDTPRLVLVLGPSGSGKSSLVRAGVVPRLRKDVETWRPLGPFRPADESGGAGELTTCLQTYIDGATLAAGHDKATALLIVDQLEELLIGGDLAKALLPMLGNALAHSGSLLAIATLRSDFLAAFQREVGKLEPRTRDGLRHVPVVVNPLPVERFSEIIEGPARQAKLTVDNSLTTALVRESGHADSLPLLAFVLRRLYDLDQMDTRPGRRGRLDLDEYEQIGRLEGAVRTTAEQILSRFAPDAEELIALRNAFIPGLAQVSDGGRYLKRQALVEKLPAAARRLLEAFVEDRLLTAGIDSAGERTIEVAHEALLRTWPRLAHWLAEDRDKLHQHDAIRRAAQEWDKNARAQDHLIHRDGRLRDAVTLTANTRFAFDSDSTETAYLKACNEDQHAREAAKLEEQERRVRDARRLNFVSIFAAVSLAVLATWAFTQRNRAEAERVVSLSRSLAANSRLLFDRTGVELQTAALLAAESLQRSRTFEADAAIRTALGHMLEPVSTLMHPSKVEQVTLSYDGRFVASLSRVRSAMLVKISELHTGKMLSEQQLPWRPSAYHFAFTPDAKHLTVSDGEAMLLWEWQTSKPPLRIPEFAKVYPENASISKDSKWLAAAVPEGVAIYDLSAKVWQRRIEFPKAERSLHKVSFSPMDARRLFVGTEGGDVFSVDVVSGSEQLLTRAGRVRVVRTPPSSQPGGPEVTKASTRADIQRIVPSPNGKLLVVVDDTGYLQIWDVEAVPAQLVSAVDAGAEFVEVVFAPSGMVFVSADNAGIATVWDALTSKVLASRNLGQFTTAVAFPNETHVLTANWSGTATVWNWTRNEIAGRSLGGAVESLAANPSHFVTAGDDGGVRAWKLPMRRFGQKQFESDVRRIVGAPGGNRLAIATEAHLVVSDMQSGVDIPKQLRSIGTDDMQFSKDASLLAMARSSGVVVLDAGSGKVQRWFRLPVASMDYRDPTDSDRVLRVISIPNGQVSSDFFDDQEVEETATIEWHPNAPTELRTRTADNVTLTVRRRLQFVTGDPRQHGLHEVGSRGSFISPLAFSADGRRLAAAALDYVWVFDVESGKRVARLTMGLSRGDPSFGAADNIDVTAEDVVDMWFTADTHRLVLLTRAGLKVWDLDSATLSAVADGSCHAAEPNASGFVAATTVDGIVVHDGGCKIVGRIETADDFLAMSPDGSLVATASRAASDDMDGRTHQARVWQVKDGTPRLQITIGTTVTAAQFDGESRYFAVGERSGRARVFDLTDQKQIAQIQHVGLVRSVHFGPGARELISQSDDSKRSIFISPLSPEVLVEEVCARSVRNLNRVEWGDYMEGEAVRSTCPQLPAPGAD